MLERRDRSRGSGINVSGRYRSGFGGRDFNEAGGLVEGPGPKVESR